MSSIQADVFALHGFLGCCEDWKEVFNHLKGEMPHWKVYAVDIFSEDFLQGQLLPSMSDWGARFNHWVRQNSRPDTQKILAGYSMGGRLALHSVRADPQLWSGIVFLSTNPGLISKKEKEERISNDQRWAQRFLEEDFHAVSEDWESQPIFRGGTSPPRKAQSLPNKDILARCLTQWSLGHQDNFVELIEKWETRQIWAVGEMDKKFVDILTQFTSSEKRQKWVVEDSYHRLLSEAPQEISHFIVRVGLLHLTEEKDP